MPKRYFDESSGVKAGVISHDLRRALDLRRNETPSWIYRMRVLGYPPGWLRKAQIARSTISTFEGYDAKPSPDNDDQMYNTELLVEYPGFNAPLKNGVVDRCEELGMPPMLPHQQLNFAVKCMKTPKPVPYKRIKLSPLAKPSEEDSGGEGSENKDSTSTTMSSKDLEATRESENLDVTKESSDLEAAKENEDLGDEEQDSAENPQKESKECSQEKPHETSKSELKLISVGSPVPSSLNAKKPPLENFAEGMGELIYFENLATSTGAFDKMRSVLRTVRNKLTEWHKS